MRVVSLSNGMFLHIMMMHRLWIEVI